MITYTDTIFYLLFLQLLIRLFVDDMRPVTKHKPLANALLRTKVVPTDAIGLFLNAPDATRPSPPKLTIPFQLGNFKPVIPVTQESPSLNEEPEHPTPLSSIVSSSRTSTPAVTNGGGKAKTTLGIDITGQLPAAIQKAKEITGKEKAHKLRYFRKIDFPDKWEELTRLFTSSAIKQVPLDTNNPKKKK